MFFPRFFHLASNFLAFIGLPLQTSETISIYYLKEKEDKTVFWKAFRVNVLKFMTVSLNFLDGWNTVYQQLPNQYVFKIQVIKLTLQGC